VTIFCAILNVTVLGKKIRGFEGLGVFLITVSMVLISISSLLSDDSSATAATNPLQGILFLLGSCMVAAAQYVYEEKVMTECNCPPLVMVGMEGFWGTVFMWGAVFPWAYIINGPDKGSMENVFDSFQMIQNSSEIQGMLFGFFVTVMLYNIAGILITKLSSSMWHTILDSFRPVSVWATDLLIFYVITQHMFGEAWTTTSYIQLAGVVVLLVGTAIYQGKVRIKGLSYDALPHGEQLPVITPQFGASPMISPSLRFHDGGLQYSTSPALLPTNGAAFHSTADAERPVAKHPDMKAPLLFFEKDIASTSA